jgi:pimeloyl-ACP methyl ester carboxylesterase
MRSPWPLLAALAIALAACGGGTGTATPDTRVGTDVSFEVPAAPGSTEVIRLAGIERGTGPAGVVLAHMLGSSQAAWSPMVASLVDEGFHVLTFDFRGHGLSGGSRDPSHAGLDLAAAVAKIRVLGAKRVLVIGASLGGTAAVVVAATQDLDGVVTMSAPAAIDSLDARAVASKVTEPSLFIVGASDDPRYVDAARAFYAAAKEPKKLQVVAGTSAHGTDLLTDAKVGKRVQKLVMDFLIDQRG